MLRPKKNSYKEFDNGKKFLPLENFPPPPPPHNFSNGPFLNFCCSVVTPERAFLRRLIDLTAGVTRPHHHIRFNTEPKNDIRMWLQFSVNGRAFFLSERWDTSSTLELYTDAAASKGYGAIFGKHWFYGPFPIAWHSLNISFLELFPITLAVHIWGATMANSCVLFFTDNAALVDIINKQTSKHKQAMILIRDLVLSCLKYANRPAENIPASKLDQKP